MVLTIVAQYFALALGSPVGSKVHSFYTSTTKHIHDIHGEARRLAGWDKKSTVEPSPGQDVEVDTKTA